MVESIVAGALAFPGLAFLNQTNTALTKAIRP